MIISVNEFIIQQKPVKEWVQLNEDQTYNYERFLEDILAVLHSDKFDNLTAKNASERALGLLPKSQIEQLRNILGTSFINNHNMKEIEDTIKRKISLKDRYIKKDGKKVLALSANERPRMIARTETVRLANEGALKTYKESNVQKVEFLATVSNRTCPECLGLDGNIYNISESTGLIPVHADCRCTFIPVIK